MASSRRREFPTGVIMDMGSSRDLRLLPIPDGMLAKMKEVNAGFTQFTIPADAYPDMCGPVQSVSFGTRVIANCDASDEAIYGVTKAVYERLGEPGVAVAAPKSTPPDMLSQDVGIRQHSGTMRVQEEVGQ